MSCWLSCSIFIIVALILFGIIAAIVFAYSLNRVKENFRRNFALSTAEYCKNLQVQTYTSPIQTPQVKGIYEYGLARGLLELSLAVSQSNCVNKIPIDSPPGFNGQYRIIAAHPYDGKKRMVATVFTDGAGSSDVTKMVIVFTGTFFLNQWATDLNFRLHNAVGIHNYRPGVQVHTGFYNLYRSARDQLWALYNSFKPAPQELYITGHSLGGALATIAAYDFAGREPIYYSFASPRVGNPVFANTFNTLVPTALRIYNIDDTITQIPLPITLGNVYQHVDSGIAFDVNFGNLRANHIDAYLQYMPQCIPNIAPCEYVNDN